MNERIGRIENKTLIEIVNSSFEDHTQFPLILFYVYLEILNKLNYFKFK